MSSLAGYFHSTSTLFTMDIYRRFGSGTAEARLILVGRLSTTVLVVLAILVASSSALVDARVFAFLLDAPGSILPPIVAIVVIGVLWKRMSARGAFWSLATGMVLGVGHLALRLTGGPFAAFMESSPVPLPLLLLITSAAVMVAVSLFNLEVKSAPVHEVPLVESGNRSGRVLGRGAVR
jgi:Na+/proline symporter